MKCKHTRKAKGRKHWPVYFYCLDCGIICDPPKGFVQPAPK